MSNLLTYLDPHTTNIRAVIKSLQERSDNLDLDLADVLEWVKTVPDLDNVLRSMLTHAEEGAFKAATNLEGILTATDPNNNMRGITNAKIK